MIVDKGCRNFLYSLGSNKSGQLGLGKNLPMSVEPTFIEALANFSVSKIACTKNSTFAMTENGDLFSWGSCKEGILGLGKKVGSSGDQYSPV